MEDLAPILFLQQFSSPVLDAIAILLANFTDLFFIIAVTMVYWCINKEKGENLGYIAVTNMLFSTFLKDCIRLPRPFGREGVVSLATESAPGYSFPSMHTQVVSNLTVTLGHYFKNLCLILSLCLLTILMGASRVYLGVHYLTDVLGGMFFGAFTSVVCIYVLRLCKNKVFVYIVTILLSSLFLITHPSDEYVMLFSGLCSFVLGTWFEKRFVQFEIPATMTRKALRLMLGISFLLAIYIGFKLLTIPALLCDTLRYSLIVFSAVGFLPYCFKKLKI